MQEDEAAPAPFAPLGRHDRVCFTGATVVDAATETVREGMSILVQGERIQSIGPDGRLDSDIAADTDVVDVSGRFVIPGLIDSHQHLATPPNRPVAEARLRRQVYSGVTAVRDMADDLRHMSDLARATRVGEIAGPDIYYASLMAGPTFFDDPRTIQVTQGATPGAVPWMRSVTDDTDLVLAVANAVGTSATAIKIYANLPPHLVAAITAEAHRQGLQVWAHATVFPSGPADVVAAGVDVVSHVNLLAYHVAPTVPESYQDKVSVSVQQFRDGRNAVEELLQAMRGRGTILDATLSMTNPRQTQPAEAEKKPPRVDPKVSIELTAMAHELGVPISTGTDYETALESPYPSLHEELAFLHTEAGLSNGEVLRSATAVGARSLGLEPVMGSIEAGKLANFVVLGANPLTDLSSLRTIDFVVKRGRRYDRSAYEPAPQKAVIAGG